MKPQTIFGIATVSLSSAALLIALSPRDFAPVDATNNNRAVVLDKLKSAEAEIEKLSERLAHLHRVLEAQRDVADAEPATAVDTDRTDRIAPLLRRLDRLESLIGTGTSAQEPVDDAEVTAEVMERAARRYQSVFLDWNQGSLVRASSLALLRRFPPAVGAMNAEVREAARAVLRHGTDPILARRIVHEYRNWDGEGVDTDLLIAASNPMLPVGIRRSAVKALRVYVKLPHVNAGLMQLRSSTDQSDLAKVIEEVLEERREASKG